nr:hypothetical protein ISGA_06555 [Gordonia sp. NB41Y]
MHQYPPAVVGVGLPGDQLPAEQSGDGGAHRLRGDLLAAREVGGGGRTLSVESCEHRGLRDRVVGGADRPESPDQSTQGEAQVGGHVEDIGRRHDHQSRLISQD